MGELGIDDLHGAVVYKYGIATPACGLREELADHKKGYIGLCCDAYGRQEHHNINRLVVYWDGLRSPTDTQFDVASGDGIVTFTGTKCPVIFRKAVS